MSELIKAALGRTEECPPVALLRDVTQNAAVRRHIENCPHCGAEVALLHAFDAEPAADERAAVEWIAQRLSGKPPIASSASLPARLRQWFGGAFAGPGLRVAGAVAAVALIVAGALYLPRAQRPERPATVDGTVWRSGSISAISPAGDVTTAPSELRWEPATNAASYRVTLMEVDRTPVWSADSNSSSVRIPDEIRGFFRGGRAFEWQVSARNAAGQTIATSPLQSFHIAVTSR